MGSLQRSFGGGAFLNGFYFWERFWFITKLSRKKRKFPYSPATTHAESPPLSTSSTRVMHLLWLMTCSDTLSSPKVHHLHYGSLSVLHAVWAQSLSHVWLFVILWTGLQTPVPMVFFQGRILEWVVTCSSRDLQAHVIWVSCIAGRLFTTAPMGKPCIFYEYLTNVY